MDFLSVLIPTSHSRLRRYAIALALTLIAFFVRLWMAPLEGGIQYVTFFPAVALAAVIGGWGAGLFSAIVGATLASYFFWAPYGMFDFSLHRSMVVANGVFLFDALVVCTALEAMHRFYRKSMDAESDLQLAASVFHNTAEGVMITDANHIIRAVNPAFTEITGYPADEVIGKTPRLLRSDRQTPDFYRSLWSVLTREGRWQGELWNRRKNGEMYLESLTISRVSDRSHGAVRFVGMFHDITELRRKEEQIHHLAFHDVLTGLPNRTLILDRLGRAIERARRDDKRFSLTFIDLDYFKVINDSLGHATGDLMLQEVARRIKDRLRSVDTLARLGGDEFLLLMEDLREPDDSERVVQELITALELPMVLLGKTVHVGASMGMAFFPDDGSDAQTLLKYADVAMYAAKNAGRNTYRFFQPSMLRDAGLVTEEPESADRVGVGIG